MKYKEDKSYFKHPFQPQQYETRKQPQGGKWGKKKITWKLNMLLKSQWINNEIKEETRKYLETNDIETLQNPWNLAKEVLRGKFISIQAFLKKKERKIDRSQISNLSDHLRELETKEQTKPQGSRRKEINKIEIF